MKAKTQYIFVKKKKSEFKKVHFSIYLFEGPERFPSPTHKTILKLQTRIRLHQKCSQKKSHKRSNTYLHPHGIIDGPLDR
jgi:uncharacterized protein YcgL (UPF0745 family)